MSGRKSEVPLHRALAEHIREQIRSGAYAVGEQIPTEQALCEESSVSRTTVRQAIQALVSEGVLDRQQGRGTFVLTSPPALDAFYRPLPQQSFHFAHLDAGWTTPSFELAAAFAMPVNQELFAMTRLRLEADQPVAITRYYSQAEGLKTAPPTQAELTGATFDAILLTRGVTSFRSNIMAEPVLLGADDARRLGVEPGTVSIATQRIGFAEQERAVRLSRTIMRPDHARLFWSLKHRSGLGKGAESQEFSTWTTSALE